MMPRPPFPPHAVVFDLDGLLVDSEGLWADAERDVLASYGARWTPAFQHRLLGKGPADVAVTIAAHVGTGDVAEVDRRMLAAVLERFRGGVPLRPGAERLVTALRGRLPLGVATNSRRVLAGAALASAGLDGAIDAVVAVEDVTAPKPAPDVYTTACRRLGAVPARSVAFEDSPVGVGSARRAGLWVVGCPSLDGVTLEEAHVTVASLHDVDPGLLVAAA